MVDIQKRIPEIGGIRPSELEEQVSRLCNHTALEIGYSITEIAGVLREGEYLPEEIKQIIKIGLHEKLIERLVSDYLNK